MKNKGLKTGLAIMLVLTLTMANILFLGVNFTSYAAGVMNQEKATSHRNVEFINRLEKELEERFKEG